MQIGHSKNEVIRMTKNTKKKVGEDPDSRDFDKTHQEEKSPSDHFDNHVTNRSKSKRLPSH